MEGQIKLPPTVQRRGRAGGGGARHSIATLHRRCKRQLGRRTVRHGTGTRKEMYIITEGGIGKHRFGSGVSHIELSVQPVSRHRRPCRNPQRPPAHPTSLQRSSRETRPGPISPLLTVRDVGDAAILHEVHIQTVWLQVPRGHRAGLQDAALLGQILLAE